VVFRIERSKPFSDQRQADTDTREWNAPLQRDTPGDAARLSDHQLDLVGTIGRHQRHEANHRTVIELELPAGDRPPLKVSASSTLYNITRSRNAGDPSGCIARSDIDDGLYSVKLISDRWPPGTRSIVARGALTASASAGNGRNLTIGAGAAAGTDVQPAKPLRAAISAKRPDGRLPNSRRRSGRMSQSTSGRTRVRPRSR
jgi:hypothetical protein